MAVVFTFYLGDSLSAHWLSITMHNIGLKAKWKIESMHFFKVHLCICNNLDPGDKLAELVVKQKFILSFKKAKA